MRDGAGGPVKTSTIGEFAALLGELMIPPSVQAILAAHIDGLPADAKDLLQTLSGYRPSVPDVASSRRGAQIRG